MGKRIDLTDQRFGRWIVISYNEEVSKQKKSTYWNCKCDCGNEVVIRGDKLRNGYTTSCGCYKKEKTRERRKDLIGQRFGRLIVISYNEEVSKQKKGSHWNCKCDCGNETVAWSRNLKSGGTTSCGCYQKEKTREQTREMWKDEEMKWKMGYKGGTTPISKYLWHLPVVKQWFNDSKQQANYTCELTGKVGGNLHTHHLKAFSTIVKEAHELNGIQIKPRVKDYTEEELHKLEEYVASWHKDTSNAVLLSEKVHVLFHSLYGYGNNTPEQFEEFKQRYMAGEFKDVL